MEQAPLQNPKVTEQKRMTMSCRHGVEGMWGGSKPGEHWKGHTQGNGEATVLEEAGEALNDMAED